jgi:hypothetical protein
MPSCIAPNHRGCSRPRGLESQADTVVPAKTAGAAEEVPSRARLSRGAGRGSYHLDRDDLVHRGDVATRYDSTRRSTRAPSTPDRSGSGSATPFGDQQTAQVAGSEPVGDAGPALAAERQGISTIRPAAAPSRSRAKASLTPASGMGSTSQLKSPRWAIPTTARRSWKPPHTEDVRCAS